MNFFNLNSDLQVSEKQRKYVIQCWSSQDGCRPIEVEKTNECWIYPKFGKPVFDLRSANECADPGFNHPIVLKAMERQMSRVVYVTDDFATEPAAELAEKLANITPGSPPRLS